ncbi:MAG: hypothetical protein Q4D59_06915, partial [Erysipelotrichaceae bacterium]|nr:hypothetical protein [Erysipelotrichaceae bacterium]
TCVRFFINGEEKKWLGAGGNFAEDQTVGFDELYEVKAGDVIIFAVNPEGNESLDGGRLAITISEVKPLPEPYPDDRTNNTVLAEDFGDQGYEGWYYGLCDWNGTAFQAIQTKDGDAYVGDENLTLNKDFIHPGVGGYHSAAYRWIVAEDGKIKVEGEYVKFANSADPAADGVTVRIVLNGAEQQWLGDTIQGNFAEDRSVTFNKTFIVKAGDELIFAVNPEGNNAYDGGRLAIKISEAEEDDRTNNANLKDDFSDKQGNNGWYYGMADWDGQNF